MPLLSEAEVEAYADEVEERGYCIIPSAIDAELLGRLLDAQRRFVPNGETVLNLLSKSEAFCDLAAAPNVLRVVKRILGEDCLLSSGTLTAPKGGTGPQEYHTDDQMYGRELFERPLKHQLSVNCATALAPFTELNGATKLVPFSHRWHIFPTRHGIFPTADADVIAAQDDEIRARGSAAEQAVMSPGSTVIWAGATWHARGTNHTARESGGGRGCVLMHYCRGELRQQENIMLSIEREQAMRMAPDVQRLIGYSSTVGALGLAESQRAPLDMPAMLLGEGGAALLAEVMENYGERVGAHFANLTAQLDEHKRREAAGSSSGSGSSKL